jgi:hypothetical protein
LTQLDEVFGIAEQAQLHLIVIGRPEQEFRPAVTEVIGPQ